MKYIQKTTCLYIFWVAWLCGCGIEDGIEKVYAFLNPYQNIYIKSDLEGVETSESGLIELQLFDRKRGGT